MNFRFSVALGTLLLTAGSVLAQDAQEAPALGLRKPLVSYNLQAGASFAGRYGSATYLSPQANFQVSNRLTLFAGGTFMRFMPGAAYYPATTEGGAPRANLRTGTNHYLLYGGGTYALSPRLALTGSAWKDMTPGLPNMGSAVNPYSGFSNLGQGVNLRADYKITENISVSGGVRVVQGGTSAPGLNPMLYSPVGY
ncbi:hypothetical protein [Solirubrum puertoriconensis]|uniref:Outer membrane protein beta-barrel domain-containing protein n=1 Tax=Solirubrum puertoriconensis TaxID=1751427 RepID=A0A9X0L455_SOLP1|nr:hypothetical protein [Solirubrum puertoriconensis]KUG07254.1 hypothetical protein ASU33_12850 [Solirubrum puertoriconensis]